MTGQPRGEQRPNAKLTATAVRAARRDPRSSATIAAERGVSGDLITKVKRGKRWDHVPMEDCNVLPTRFRFPDPSPTQLAMLRLAATGLTYKQIADRVGVRPGTVATQMRRAARKLSVRDRHAAVRTAREKGLLP